MSENTITTVRYPMMKNTYFTPWVGNDYSGQRCRILILGESSFRSDSRPDYTVQCVTEIIDGQGTYRFWTNIAIAFLNRKPNLPAERKDFWHSVAFHNYVQESVGDRPRIPPTTDMWARDRNVAALAEVVDQLKPQCVIVLGKRLWAHLPVDGSKPGPEISGAPQRQTRIYPRRDGHSFLAYGIYHPSSGFSGRLWHRFVMEAITMAETHCTSDKA